VNPQQEKHSIVILFENDVHCAIDGYPKIAGLRVAIADTAWVALVSSGDFVQGETPGAISRGQYIFDIMRSMHYDAVGLGNHEFDYNTPRLQELLAGFNAPAVCANFTDMQGNCMVAPYTIRSYGDRQVAFVGVLTPETELIDEPFAFRDENGQPIYTLNEQMYTTLVQQAVDAARVRGADYVVLLSHLGESFEGNMWTSNDLIAATHGIDVVLDAHTHNVIDTVIMNSLGRPVLLANTGTQFANIGKLWIGANGQMDITLIPTEQVHEVSPTVSNTVQRIHQLVDAQTNQVVAHSEVPILITDGNGNRMVRKAETNAGDLVTDAFRWKMGADIGMIDGSTIRKDIPAGDITYGDITDMLPYGNTVVMVQATGAQILEVLRQNTASLPEEDYNFPQVSGIRFTVTVADHSISNVEVLQANGSYAPLSTTATYTIATTDYDAYGGGFRDLFVNCIVLQYSSTLERDVLVQYITNVLGGNIGLQYANPQGRITIH